ncbi:MULTISPECIES: hypothetical protein [Flavobacterium]|jgi:hypothetical protein|uniref:DUF4625 domain-containing protein n=1 Tax=Flavobacterium cupriresistens TaxID=2893885 RepID=A0ABU4RAB8_9FLAO|nr:MULTISPECIES: hypothetical protein [unclassified Flavobacterium]KLT69736.1 hypothetical protein AB674_10795 [Flavobacterium sp. ABG]MDX6189514.1 hypothetical protein [Flavobacterium sp. Fl-318]UFH41077.1 hypothetical protein LNP23_14800 [Flavobacterium sp. F-323]
MEVFEIISFAPSEGPIGTIIRLVSSDNKNVEPESLVLEGVEFACSNNRRLNSAFTTSGVVNESYTHFSVKVPPDVSEGESYVIIFRFKKKSEYGSKVYFITYPFNDLFVVKEKD